MHNHSITFCYACTILAEGRISVVHSLPFCLDVFTINLNFFWNFLENANNKHGVTYERTCEKNKVLKYPIKFCNIYIYVCSNGHYNKTL